jgi:hypothetical protein
MKFNTAEFYEKFPSNFSRHLDRAAVTTTLQKAYIAFVLVSLSVRELNIYRRENCFKQKLKRKVEDTFYVP